MDRIEKDNQQRAKIERLIYLQDRINALTKYPLNGDEWHERVKLIDELIELRADLLAEPLKQVANEKRVIQNYCTHCGNQVPPYCCEEGVI